MPDEWDDLFDDREEYERSVTDPDTNSDDEYKATEATPIYSDSEDEDPGPPIQKTRTAEKRRDLDDEGLFQKVKLVLQFMDAIGINMPIFLDGLSWGNELCIQDSKISYKHVGLMQSEELPGILRRWWKPPWQTGSRKKHATGAGPSMKSFVLECIEETMDQELESLALKLLSPAGEDVELETLTSMGFEQMNTDAKVHAPVCLRLLTQMAHQKRQGSQNKKKDPEKIVLTIISIVSYSRSHHHCHLQKLLAIYLKFRGISAKGFDTLHAMGLTMSHKWTADVVGHISKNCMEKVVAAMDRYPWLISDDNVTIPFRVFSQQLDNQSEFGNGTAATVYIKPDAEPLSEQAIDDLKKQRAEGLKKPLTEINIMDLAQKAYPRIQAHTIHHVLRFLLDAPEFNLETYKGKDSDALKPPPPVDQLPCGPDHVALQYLLGTVNIPEASYKDHERLIDEFFGQLGWKTPGQQMRLAMKKVVAWVGDQLTMDWIRGLFKFRAEDENSFERLDFIVLSFGWLHLQMAFAKSLHKQYLGTSEGRGLRHAFELLKQKGLTRVLTQGPFHHDLEEALYHIAEAHL
ncbi:hypothetical protein H0H81_001411 [Sphagnurus paluster]|uniref:DUF6589 domain-containing protein n=1 Tax=Sphagnurus paluster TaxID=117069 RepID=A0A9P7K1Q6_9AGAR|nr:hypothetical protein H0H81_001411 [Sphagnurus paluster]